MVTSTRVPNLEHDRAGSAAQTQSSTRKWLIHKGKLAEWTGLTGHFAKALILRSFFETTVQHCYPQPG